jgi:tripartite-type tricarboxylate transporter receptor subunit TctC
MKKAALVIACLAASWPAAAMAQNYPTKPIKMIVPISVGSITDVAARLTAQELEQRLGQSVIVINKPDAVRGQPRHHVVQPADHSEPAV